MILIISLVSNPGQVNQNRLLPVRIQLCYFLYRLSCAKQRLTIFDNPEVSNQHRHKELYSKLKSFLLLERTFLDFVELLVAQPSGFRSWFTSFGFSYSKLARPPMLEVRRYDSTA